MFMEDFYGKYRDSRAAVETKIREGEECEKSS